MNMNKTNRTDDQSIYLVVFDFCA